MRKRQQTLWLAGFVGVSAACIISFLTSNILQVDQPSDQHFHPLLAANPDQGKLVKLSDVSSMFDEHFERPKSKNDILIDSHEYAERNIHLFSPSDLAPNHNFTPPEIRHHNFHGSNLLNFNQSQSLLYKSAYGK